LNKEQINGCRKAETPLSGGLHEAARIAQTRKRQWPSAWLTQPREALIHLAPNGWYGKQLPATNQTLFLTFDPYKMAGDNGNITSFSIAFNQFK
jgi:hypothetical protein